MPVEVFWSRFAEPTHVNCGDEFTEVRFVREDEAPGTELAYSDIGVCLRSDFSERRAGVRMIHFGCIEATDAAGRGGAENLRHTRISPCAGAPYPAGVTIVTTVSDGADVGVTDRDRERATSAWVLWPRIVSSISR